VSAMAREHRPQERARVAMGDRPPANSRCVRCVYDLAGCEAGAACPECGHPVADSLSPHWAHRSGRRYLSTVEGGALLLAGWGLMVLAAALLVPLILLSVGIGTVACLAATARDPRPEFAAHERWRVAGRVLPAHGAVLLILGVFPAPDRAGMALATAGGSLWLFGMGGALRSLGGVASRLPRCETTVLWEIAAVLCVLSALLVAVLGSLTMIDDDVAVALVCVVAPLLGLSALATVVAGVLTARAVHHAQRLAPDAPARLHT